MESETLDATSESEKVDFEKIATLEQPQETDIDEAIRLAAPSTQFQSAPQRPDFVPSLRLDNDEDCHHPLSASSRIDHEDDEEPSGLLPSSNRSWATIPKTLPLPNWLVRKLRHVLERPLIGSADDARSQCWSLPCSPRWLTHRRWLPKSHSNNSWRSWRTASPMLLLSDRSKTLSSSSESWTRMRSLSDRLNAAQRTLESAERFGRHSRGFIIEARRLLDDSEELRRSVEELQLQQQQQQTKPVLKNRLLLHSNMWRTRPSRSTSTLPSRLLNRLISIRREIVRSTFGVGLDIVCQ